MVYNRVEVNKVDRSILHCDLNNFYASVEKLYHPELAGKPIAVAGRAEERKGIVLAKSEEAKSYGVKTGDTIWEAKLKCPDITILPPHFEKYQKYSGVVRCIYERYTDLVEAFGPDECWLDVSGSDMVAEDIAQAVRRDLKSEIGLTVSVGVSFNKVFAKLGSDMKKPDAVTVISRDNYQNKVWPLPVEELLFVGRATKRRLTEMGVFTIGDLALANENMLVNKFGKNGILLRQYARGEDTSIVSRATYTPPPKSIGNSRTFPKDLCDEQEIYEAITMAAEKVGKRLRDKGLYAGGVSISVKDSNRVTKQFDESIDLTQSSEIITKKAMEMFLKNCRDILPVRAVGVRLYALSDISYDEQLDFDGIIGRCDREMQRETAYDALKNRFGNEAVTRGNVLGKNIFESVCATHFGRIPR